MARITKTITIPGAGRDKGKTFVLTEMAPRDGHRWATHALFAIINGGFDIPEDLLDAGFAGLATLGIKALSSARIENMEPLLDGLFSCVQVMPDPAKPTLLRSDIEADIEESATFFLLQKEVLMLHIEPFMSGIK